MPFFVCLNRRGPPADYALHLESVKVADYAFPHVQKRPMYIYFKGENVL
jgi:hypothetical protein